MRAEDEARFQRIQKRRDRLLMAIFLLDTSVIIDALNRKRGRWQLLALIGRSGRHAGLLGGDAHRNLCWHSAEGVCVHGALSGWAGTLRTWTRDWRATQACSRMNGARKGRTLGVVDLIIAATALAHRLVLMTDNRKDFPMPQLALYPLP